MAQYEGRVQGNRGFPSDTDTVRDDPLGGWCTDQSGQGVAVGVWTEGLLSDAREIVERDLLKEPLLSLDRLAREVRAYQRWIQEFAGPFTDLAQAERVAEANLGLINQVRGADPEQQRLVQVAARYFVRRTDGDDDMLSPYGFDDDAEVFNAVAVALGLGERRLAIV